MGLCYHAAMSSVDTSRLPNDPAALKDIIESYARNEESYKDELHLLREQIRLLEMKLFGRKSEKYPPDPDDPLQMNLFTELEKLKAAVGDVSKDIKVEAHSRKKRGRKPLPKDFPRVDDIHDISEEEKMCGCGTEKTRIGEEVAERLDYIPGKFRVIREIRPKYACRNCEGLEDDGPAVSIAPLPARLIPKSMATSGLQAHVLASKFADGLPFYRQEKMFARMGVELSRSTMCNWSIKGAARCSPFLELAQAEIRSGPLINIDETTLLVLEELGRSNKKKSYMWLFRGGDPKKPLVYYQYHPTRAGNVPAEFLQGYSGYVQTDGYSGYDFLDKQKDITHLACWAHVRRKFMDVINASSKRKRRKRGNADDVLDLIQKLYKIEKKAKLEKLEPEELLLLRHEKAKPLLNKIKKLLDALRDYTPPKGLLGKAVHYALKQWPRLQHYTDDANLRLDNNLAENAIRPFVVGRKNWLFSGHPDGATASATMFTLIESAKASGLEPYWYLRYIFEKIPTAKSEADFKMLLPNHIDIEKIPDYKLVGQV